jgi:hypothetical protein
MIQYEQILRKLIEDVNQIRRRVGLLDTLESGYVGLAGDESVAGVKTFQDGISLGNETLSVYDTGTYSPVITGSTGNPTLTYTTQIGRFTQIGDRVDYFIRIAINNISVAGTGDLRISLPSVASNAHPATVSVNGVDVPGTSVNMMFRTVTGQAYGIIVANQDNAAEQVVPVTAIANGDGILIQGVYFV